VGLGAQAQGIAATGRWNRDMKTLASLLLGLPLLVPFVGGRQELTRTGVERAILAQMNGTAAGRITSRVDCRLLGSPSTGGGPVRYSCLLTGSRGSERQVVTVSGRSWRAEWAPVRG
jgi:hypothetical protein